MNREDISELHYITHIDNISSMMEHGILCHREAKRLRHISVALQDVQDKRAGKNVPGGRPLHEYVNLYISARNPMLFKRRSQHQELCVLIVSPDVLDIPGVVITDGNAASDYTIFLPSPSGLRKVDKDLVYAEYWTDPDTFRQWEKARVKCAEVLVPGKVEGRFVVGAYASCDFTAKRLNDMGTGLSITINRNLFFM